MSFLYDKPLIARIAEILAALAGVYFVLLFIVNADEAPLLALVFLGIGALAIADGFVLQMRKSCAWSLNFAVMIVIAVAGLTLFAFAGSGTGLAVALLMALTVLSWTMRLTRDYFSSQTGARCG